MKRLRILALPVAAALSVVGFLAPGAASGAAPDPAGAAAPHVTQGARHAARTCAAAATKGYAACNALVRVDANGRPAAQSAPAGLNPADIRSAYALTAANSGGRTVAIVDAYNDPTAESDLGVYRSTFGLSACTTANGCFRKVSQSGGSKLPRTDAGWATEISLDLDMVSATCPDCKILLVEATTPSFTNLAAAVNYAAGRAGVVAISNSYGGSDSSPLSAYNHPGIAITASTGDAGYGIESPASFDSVVAVGGTSLTRAGGTVRGWSEAAWSGAGSGCSSLNAKPSWQSAATQCSGKANADVSAVADPATGVSVYDSTPYQGSSGWAVYGGTSAASPIVASVYALSGNTSGYPASYTWSQAGSLNDVTTGSNGSCPTRVWCTAGTGWDGPTGLGTPKGTSAF
ncbi:hypothetical protein M6D93_07395 [Jatrophihabitans telluris]|uniref:Peptidase S53 domain-containing protein n=1 Tax=Jatrophihabitans telluris TaxID=2038343 RepID=A0ABY4R1Z5_9ACTN|nr:hypothetical protein [Jatrophihabitans telluris]UQX89819.1 hypothetical protein M6D93_07395 [Jatrophihabitans telluris]